MTPQELHELLGKPDGEYLEARVRQTQEELKKPRDEAHRMRLEAQAENYLGVLQYLEEQAIIREATTFAVRAGTDIKTLKDTLKPQEHIHITSSGAKYYVLSKATGEPIEMCGTDSLAIVKDFQVPADLVQSFAKREKGATVRLRKMAKEVQERRNRIQSIQSAVAAVSRALLEGTEMSITKGEAYLSANAKSLAKEYRARMKLIAKGHWTEQRGTDCYVNGHAYPSFQSVK